MSTRRTMLKMIGGTFAATTPFLSGAVAFASAPTDARLAVVILRGGLDSLTAVPPFADPDYARLRPTTAVPRPGEENGAVDLDGHFGLHPTLAPLKTWYDEGELLILPATGTNYAKRSHFDAQNVLENGTGTPFGAADGWLGRALGPLADGGNRAGLAVGHGVPLILRSQHTVRTLAPTNLSAPDDDFLARVAMIYAGDPLFSDMLASARTSAEGPAGSMARNMTAREAGGKIHREIAESAGRLLAQAGGPRIAVMETGGWDTHARVHAKLPPQLTALAGGLDGLRQGLGNAWKKTIVLVVSEFGRTAAENGNKGSDHGYGGLTLALGGAVNGGRIAGGWPGLAQSALFEGRDIMPTIPLQAVFKGVLHDHLGLSVRTIEDTVFPASSQIPVFEGLIRSA